MRFPGSDLGYRWALLSQKPWLFGSWRKFAFATLVLLTVPSGLILFVASSTVQERLERQTFRELEVWASVFARQITEEIGALSRYVESFASRPSLARAAAVNDLVDLEKQLAALVDNNGKITRAVFVTPQGTLLTAHPNDPVVLGRNFSDRDWFRGAASLSNSAYVSEIYRRSAFGEEIVITIGCAVRDGTGKPLGLIGAQYLIRDLNTWIDRLLEHTPQELIIADQNGHAIRDKRKVLNQIAKPFSQQSGSSQSATRPYRKIQLADEVQFVSRLALNEPRWTFYLLKPKAIAKLQVRDIQLVVLILFALSVALFLAIGLVWIRTLFRYAHGIERSNRHLEYFCYSIAHNFRAPLRAFTGFTDILLTDQRQPLNAEARDYVERISTSAVLMNNLVNDLLAFGKISHAEINVEKLEIETVIRSALRGLKEEIQASGAKVDLVGAFDGVLADKSLLQQILRELISNAIKFVPASTVPEIRIRTEGDGNCVRLWVHDNGVGIDPRFKDQIFEIFHKLEARSAGTGVGLAIARNAAERMGGSIGVESTPGQGSSFWVDLPRG